MGIQVYSNEGDCSSPRGDNSKRVKMLWFFFSNLVLKNQQAKFNNILGWREFKFLQIKGQTFFKGDIIKNKCKNGTESLKISKITWPILTRLITNHSWGKGIKVHSNGEGHRSSKGDNSDIVKLHWVFFFKETFFSRTIWSNSIKLNINYPQAKGIKFVQRRASSSSKRRLSQKCKNRVWSFKNLLLKNY
jgi:hypothetical protein